MNILYSRIFTFFFIAVFATFSPQLHAQAAVDIDSLLGTDRYADRTTRTITIEDKYADVHPTAPSVKITIEYTPLTNEVRLFYECLASNFEIGEAMNTAISVFTDFAADYGYKRYYYKEKDRTRYFRNQSSEENIRMAQYTSHVYFTR